MLGVELDTSRSEVLLETWLGVIKGSVEEESSARALKTGSDKQITRKTDNKYILIIFFIFPFD